VQLKTAEPATPEALKRLCPDVSNGFCSSRIYLIPRTSTFQGFYPIPKSKLIEGSRAKKDMSKAKSWTDRVSPIDALLYVVYKVWEMHEKEGGDPQFRFKVLWPQFSHKA
jgi:hypothetical protein